MDFAKYLPDAARMAFVPAAALHSQLAGVGTTAMYGGAGRAGTGPECAVPLDRAMTALLWRLFGDSAALRMSLRESQSRLFDKPFQVVLGGRHAHFPLTARMRERVIETHWMPVLRELDTRLRVFGVAPWYFEPLKLRGAGGGSSDDGAVPRRAHLAPGARRARRRNPAPWQDAREADAYIGGGGGDASSSCSADGGGDDSSSASDDDELEEEDGDGALDLWVPRVPPLGTGDVETYVLDGRQHLQWRWNAAANWRGRKTDQVDAGVHVEVESMPDIGGRYTSDFAALVRDHLLVRDLGRLLCAAGENAVHPLHVIEFHPNIADATGTRGAATYRDTSSVQPYFATGQTLFPGEPGRAFDTRTPLERVQQLHAEQLREDGRHGGAAPLAEHAYMPPGYAPAGGGAAPFAVEAALAAKRDVFLANHPEAAALFPNLGAAGRARPANTLELQPYEHFVAAPVHAPDTAALLPLINRLDQLVASLGDYPLEMVATAPPYPPQPAHPFPPPTPPDHPRSWAWAAAAAAARAAPGRAAAVARATRAACSSSSRAACARAPTCSRPSCAPRLCARTPRRCSARTGRAASCSGGATGARPRRASATSCARTSTSRSSSRARRCSASTRWRRTSSTA